MQIKQHPRFSLGFFPTPVHPLPRLTRLLRGPQLHICLLYTSPSPRDKF